MLSCSNIDNPETQNDEINSDIVFFEDFSSLDRWDNNGWIIGSSRALPNPPYVLFYNSGAKGDEQGYLSTQLDLMGAREISFSLNGDYRSIQIKINEYIITDYEPFISGENVKIRLAGFEVSNNSTVFIYANPKEYYQISIDDIKITKKAS